MLDVFLDKGVIQALVFYFCVSAKFHLYHCPNWYCSW